MMKKICAVSIFIILGWIPVSALTLGGVVADAKSGKAVQGASVGIEELLLVTETDAQGRFSFKDIPRGYYTLTFAHESYGRTALQIRVKRNFFISHELSPQVYDAGTKVKDYAEHQKPSGDQSISRDDIKKYPMRGAGDSMHLLQSLPGVGGGYSLATVPVIRGTNPLFNKYYIDDIPIDYPFHYAGALVPVISAINEEAIDSVRIVKGNAPVWTSDNLGNVIMIKSAEPEKGGVNARMIFDPVIPVMPTLSVTAVPDKDLSIVAAGRRSNADWLFDADKADVSIADYFLKVSYTGLPRHRFTILSAGSRDYVDYDDLYARSGFNASGLTWEYLVSDRLYLKTVLSNNSFRQEINNLKTYADGIGEKILFNPDQYRAMQMLTYTSGNFYGKAGYEAVKYTNGCRGTVDLSEIAGTSYLRGYSADPLVVFPVEGTSLSMFAEAGGTYGRMYFDGSIKYEYYGPADDSGVSYSGEGGYHLGEKTSVYGKFGRYYAHPDIYYYLGNLSLSFKLARADNFAVGVHREITRAIGFQGEFYYNIYDNLNPGVLYNVNNDLAKKMFQFHPFADENDGRTYGVEFSVKGSLYGFSGWANYSYSVSKRNSDTADDFYSDFDQTHLFRVVVSRTIGKWDLSSILHINSPMPYTPVTGSTVSGGKYSAVYGKRNSGRPEITRRLDLKAVYKMDRGHRFFIECWNATINRKNAVTQNWSTKRRYGDYNPSNVYDLPFFLWLGVEICL